MSAIGWIADIDFRSDDLMFRADGGLQMRFRNVLIAAICIVVTPAAYVLLSDLYVGLVAPGSDPAAKQKARLLLWREVHQGWSRLAEVAVEPDDFPASIIPDGPSLVETVPTCPEYVIRAREPETELFYRAGSYLTHFPMRVELEEDRAHFVHANKLSVPQLALLDACLQGTPFGKQCSNWLGRTKPTRDEVLAKLGDHKLIARRPGGHCWQLHEFRFSE